MAAADEAARSLTNPLTRGLLVLTFSGGIVDAISFLALGTVFSAAMNGNILLLGFGIAGEGDLPVVAPLVALAAFLVGAVAGGELMRHRAGEPADSFAGTLVVEAALIGAAAVFALVSDVEPAEVSAGVVIALLALSMGLRTATARAIGVPDLSTTLVTLGLVGLASDAVAGGESPPAARRRVAAPAALLAGAIAGALLLRVEVAVALFAAAAIAALVALDYARAA